MRARLRRKYMELPNRFFPNSTNTGQPLLVTKGLFPEQAQNELTLL